MKLYICKNKSTFNYGVFATLNPRIHVPVGYSLCAKFDHFNVSRIALKSALKIGEVTPGISADVAVNRLFSEAWKSGEKFTLESV